MIYWICLCIVPPFYSHSLEVIPISLLTVKPSPTLPPLAIDPSFPVFLGLGESRPSVQFPTRLLPEGLHRLLPLKCQEGPSLRLW
jgi:hypothetical protein